MESNRIPNVLEITLTLALMFLILVCFFLSCIGCSTTRCPECVPEIVTREIQVPVRYCEPPPQFEDLELAAWPVLPGNPTEDDIKQWYARCVSTLEARERALLNRIELYREVLSGYDQ
jgi:hypothetical protein